MFQLISSLFRTFPLILAWLYFIVAVLCVTVHIKCIKEKGNLSIGEWAFSIWNTGYVLFFLAARIFFADFWRSVFSIAGVLAIFISFIWARYEDRRTGRRWWNW